MFGFDPAYIETAPIAHVEYWHRRAFAFAQAQSNARKRQDELDSAIGAAVKGMR